MKGLVLSAAALVLLVIASAGVLRFYRGNKEFRVFLGAFAAAVVLYTGSTRDQASRKRIAACIQ